MCGIAGIIDLTGKRQPEAATLQRMADALCHRGPDDDGYLVRPGFGFANRRLSIVGLADGQQPISNEDRSVAVVFNGELFDYPERKRSCRPGATSSARTATPRSGPPLRGARRGHVRAAARPVRRRALGPRQAHHLAGPRPRRHLPAVLTRQGDWLLCGSEIKALLASGWCRRAPDPRGLDHFFTSSPWARADLLRGGQVAAAGPLPQVACRDGKPAEIVERHYWDLDFPDAGARRPAGRPGAGRRVRGDLPPGGRDPAAGRRAGGQLLSAAASIRPGAGHGREVRGSAGAELHHPGSGKGSTKRRGDVDGAAIGCRPTIVRSDRRDRRHLSELIAAADCPVVDTSCAALWRCRRRCTTRATRWR